MKEVLTAAQWGGGDHGRRGASGWRGLRIDDGDAQGVGWLLASRRPRRARSDVCGRLVAEDHKPWKTRGVQTWYGELRLGA
jgi:hypothetical protein